MIRRSTRSKVWVIRRLFSIYRGNSTTQLPCTRSNKIHAALQSDSRHGSGQMHRSSGWMCLHSVRQRSLPVLSSCFRRGQDLTEGDPTAIPFSLPLFREERFNEQATTQSARHLFESSAQREHRCNHLSDRGSPVARNGTRLRRL